MPNWCDNHLNIEGSPQEIKRFLDRAMGLPAQFVPEFEWEKRFSHTESRFCFNALIPVPREVLEAGYNGLNKCSREIPLMERKTSGYSWCIDQWGTKWDVWSSGITIENCGWREGDSWVSFDFDTAWSPPLPWLEKVAPMFPELTFELHYEEPGCYFAGDVYACGDEFQVDEYDDDRLRDLFLWDEEDEDEEDEEVE